MTAAPVIEIPGLEEDDGYQSKRRSDPSEDSEEGLKEGSVESHEEGQRRMTDNARRTSDGSTDEAVILDAYARASRSSSTSSESLSLSQTPSPEPSPPDEKHLSLPSVLPPMPRSQSYGQDWYRDEGERTPTQESVAEALTGRRPPSPDEELGEARLMVPGRPLGLTLSIPTDPVRAASTSPGTPPQTQFAASAAQYELPPGMAPPVARSPIPPGIASQHQRDQVQTSPMSAMFTSSPMSALSPMSAMSPMSPMSPVTVERLTLARNESGASTSKDKEKKGGFFSKKKEKAKTRTGCLDPCSAERRRPMRPRQSPIFPRRDPQRRQLSLGLRNLQSPLVCHHPVHRLLLASTPSPVIQFMLSARSTDSATLSLQMHVDPYMSRSSSRISCFGTSV